MLLLLSLLACSGCNPPAEPAPEGPTARGQMPERPDIVLVVVEAMRPDHLGVYGYARDTTPNLDAWAQDAAVFDDVFAHATWSRPTMASLLTGTLPGEHGLHTQNDTPTVTTPALQQLLSERDGYATFAVVTSPLLGPGNNPFMRGFDTLDGSIAKGPDARSRPTASDAVERASELWTAHQDAHPDQPAFLLVYLVDPLPPWVTHTGHELGEEPVDRYDSELAGVDAALGSLFETVGDQALVIVTADHGVSLGAPRPEGIGGPPFVELVHVPLLVRGPGIVAEHHGKLLAQVDIAPGILRTAGLKRSPTHPSPGWKISPFGNLEYGRRVVPMEVHGGQVLRAVRDRRHVLMVTDKGVPRLYDLQADPKQTHELIGDPTTRETALAVAKEMRSALPRPPKPPTEEGAPKDAPEPEGTPAPKPE